MTTGEFSGNRPSMVRLRDSRAAFCRRAIRPLLFRVGTLTTVSVLLLILRSGSLPSTHAQTHPDALATVPEARMSSRRVRLPVNDGGDIRFSHLSTKEGLSQTRVGQIVQDDEGFLWFGTQYGLDRYDGNNFKVFVHDPNRENSLSCAFVYSLFKDRDGTLWVGCNNVVDRFDKMSETFTHYRIARETPNGLPVNVSGISQDHAGTLWLSTGSGLYRLDPATGRVTHYGHDPLNSSSLSSDQVKSTNEDSDHRFWVADGDDLEEFDSGQGKVLLRVPLAELTELGQKAAMGLVSSYEDHLGMLWIIYTSSTHGSGLAVLDRATNTLIGYSIYDQRAGRELSSGVVAAVEDANKTLWLATKSDGLLRFDREHGMFIRYRNHPDDLDSLAEDRPISLCADREGNVWAGLYATSPDFFHSTPRSFVPVLHRLNNPKSFGETFVNAIYEDHQGVLWIGATGALIRADRKSGRFTSYPPPGPKLDNDIVAITEDRAGALWVGSVGGGLGRFDRQTGRYKIYRHNPSDPSSLSDDAVSRIFIDHTGAMWVTTWSGFDRYDPATERFVTYKRDKETQREEYYNITEDRSGTLWVGGIMGLTRFDPESGRSTLYNHNPDNPESLSDNIVNNVYIDHLGTVWAATQNGLNKLDTKSGTFTKYFATDGLPINNLSCILEDREGQLWISTSRGLSRFDPVAKVFKNYATADGLPGDDLTGWDACFKSSRGEMFFGGFSGAVAFYPEKVEDPSFVPPIVLTEFQLFGKPVDIGPQSLLKKSITYSNNLTLAHQQNVFSLAFSALSYLNPTANRYRYMLEGLDHQWTEVGSDRRVATYTTLPAGRYTFRVQGATSRGVWHEPGAKLLITILPPWWARWWFGTFCAIAVAVILWALYRFRLRQVAREFSMGLEARVDERIRIARELHDTLLQGFQGITLRVQGVANNMSNHDPLRKTLDDILDCSDEVLREARHRVRSLRRRATGENEIRERLTKCGEELSKEYAAALILTVVGTPKVLEPTVQDEAYKIASEAITNAFRHASARRIEVELTYDCSSLRIKVRDDGVGIDKAVLRNGQPGHWGLIGMGERARTIRAELHIGSREAARGTEVELVVPASVAYPQEK
jgi:ligand-binding sensor domain-containing protein/signal transduction histidine kinase